MQNPPPGQPSKSSTGLDENVAALLSYIFGWVSGLIFFLIEKDSQLVRFHAMQSILFNALIAIGGFVLWVVVFILTIIASQLADVLGTIIVLLGTLLYFAFLLGILIAWVMCLIRAYQGKYFKLPIIGNFAEKFSSK